VDDGVSAADPHPVGSEKGYGMAGSDRMAESDRFMRFRVILLLGAAALLHLSTAQASEEPARSPWTTSRLRGSPDPPKPLVPEPVFDNLAIENGLELVALAGRLFVVERSGRIWSFPENGDGSGADVFVDLRLVHPRIGAAYGIAFSPGWPATREVYLTYTTGAGLEDGTRLSRFRFDWPEGEPPRLEPGSEEILLTWRSGGHNGAHLQFGPDGMLYVSTGDATAPSPPDGLATGQDNSDLLSCILRIDVTGSASDLPYRIPPDNPFIDRESVRPEIWAFGFRNPWKMSFDSRRRLWVGDVGWELWEMIHLVEKGGNYGWSAVEASNPILPETASELAPISAPVAAHPHSEAASITGGFEYTGTRLPDLIGAYIYGDYETGLIWALRHDGNQVTEHRIIADTPHKVVSFGIGNDGELYYLHYGTPSALCRLVPNPRVGQPSTFPRELSETGIYSNVSKREPAPGVYEFTIHEPMWEDGATATRYIALPGNTTVETTYQYRRNGTYRASTKWPADAVLARTIRIGPLPVETQLLHYDGDAWSGYSYRWNEDATDASLVEAGGDTFEVPSQGWKGGNRYRIASRAECMRCHNMWNGFTPAFDPMQLSGFASFPRQPAREVAVALGLANPLFFHKDEARGQLAGSRGGGSLEKRARSWLHANCAHCHRRHGGGSVPLEVDFDRALSETALLWQMPTRGGFGLSEPRIVVPGEPWRSVLQYRISSLGSGHMPPLGSREVDRHGANLLWDWIANLPREQGEVTEATGLTETSAALLATHRIAAGTVGESEKRQMIESGLQSSTANVRDLYEAFRPPENRPEAHRLDPAGVLELTGDIRSGGKLLSPAGKLASCLACHSAGTGGGALGPNLNGVGSRLSREQLLESLTDPSRTIAPDYRVWTVETRHGELHSGFRRPSGDDTWILALATGQELAIPLSEVRTARPQPQSLMPEGLLTQLSEQEVADLLAYLESLR